MLEIEILPSLMCANLATLKQSLQELEAVGIKTAHIDLIDGHFSPSMPIGMDIIAKVREHSNLKCDVHIMSKDNEWYVSEALKMGAHSVTFHCETTLHIDRIVTLIKKQGAQAGIALNPATSLSVLDYMLPYCDLVLLMLINPGFAGDKNEKQVPYARQKVMDLKNKIQQAGASAKISVDGRVSMELIPGLVASGAQKLVAGSTSLFRSNFSLKENKEHIDNLITQALGGRHE